MRYFQYKLYSKWRRVYYAANYAIFSRSFHIVLPGLRTENHLCYSTNNWSIKEHPLQVSTLYITWFSLHNKHRHLLYFFNLCISFPILNHFQGLSLATFISFNVLLVNSCFEVFVHNRLSKMIDNMYNVTVWIKHQAPAVLLCTYPLDSVIHPMNNRGQTICHPRKKYLQSIFVASLLQ